MFESVHAMQWMLGISVITNVLWMVVAGVLFFATRTQEPVHQFIELPGVERVQSDAEVWRGAA